MAIYPNILRTFANSRVIVPYWRRSGLQCLDAGVGTVCPITDFIPTVHLLLVFLFPTPRV